MIDIEPVVRHWSENHWRGSIRVHRHAANGQKKPTDPFAWVARAAG